MEFKDKVKLSDLRIATGQQRKEAAKPPVYVPVVTDTVQQNKLQFSYVVLLSRTYFWAILTAIPNARDVSGS
jgi:hypothetical protein